jgi:Arc/MetJ family transcription regulator
MARVKTTTYIDERLRRAAKSAAARSGMKEYELYEDALRRYLGWDVVDTLLARSSDLTEDEAMRIALEEVQAARGERGRTAALPPSGPPGEPGRG